MLLLLEESDMVWYVLTGNLSTSDRGARQRRLRILERNNNITYTILRVMRGLTTSTNSVSNRGLVDTSVGVIVIHKPTCSAGVLRSSSSNS